MSKPARSGTQTPTRTRKRAQKAARRPPARRRPTPPAARKKPRRFPAEPLDLADVEKLRAKCSRSAPTGIRNRALIALLYRSGLRIGEALALFPKDLDPAAHAVRVLHGKGDKARTAPLPEDAADAIGRWLDCRKRLGIPPRAPVFCTITSAKKARPQYWRPGHVDRYTQQPGEPLAANYVRALCKRLARKAGIHKRVHPHGLRHGFTKAQAEAGVPLHAIRQALGHRSLHTTSVYVDRIAPAEAIAASIERTKHLAVAP